MKETPATFEIRIRGRLTPDWSEWFEGLAITEQANGESVLAGPVRDQAELFGLLLKIRDLGLELISVNRIETDGG